MSVATATAIEIAIAAGTGAAGAYGAHATAGAAKKSAQIQATSANHAAELQTAAANHAADVQKQSSDAALAFQKQQAAQDLVNANAIQQGNYNQWAAKEGRLAPLSALTGGAPIVIPPYVPLTAANGGTAGITTTGLPAGTNAQTAPIAAAGGPPSPMAPTPTNQNQMVTMRAPNGQMKMVPALMVGHYQQLGAQVVGGPTQVGGYQ